MAVTVKPRRLLYLPWPKTRRTTGESVQSRILSDRPLVDLQSRCQLGYRNTVSVALNDLGDHVWIGPVTNPLRGSKNGPRRPEWGHFEQTLETSSLFSVVRITSSHYLHSVQVTSDQVHLEGLTRTITRAYRSMSLVSQSRVGWVRLECETSYRDLRGHNQARTHRDPGLADP